MNRVMLVLIAVAVGCLVNTPQLKLKGVPMVLTYAVGLYLAYWLLNSQGLVEGGLWDEIKKVLDPPNRVPPPPPPPRNIKRGVTRPYFPTTTRRPTTRAL